MSQTTGSQATSKLTSIPAQTKPFDKDKRRDTNKKLVELETLQFQLKKASESLKDAEKKQQLEQSRHQDLVGRVEEANNVLSVAQEEIDCDPYPEGAQPIARIKKRDELALYVNQLEAALAAQRKATSDAQNQLVTAERYFMAAEKSLARCAEGLEDTIQSKKDMDQYDTMKAKKIAKFENEVKKRKEKEERELQQAKEMQAQELEEIKRKNTAIARRQQNEARRRMKAANEQTLELSIQMKDLNEKNMQDRIEAVLELKDNTRAVNAELATLANKHVEKVKDAKNRLDSQKEELLSQGLNPYVEFRKEEFQKADENKEKKMKAAVEKNKKELAERLDREQKFIEKQEKAKLHALEYEKAHRASQGRHVVEEKNRNFILSRTNGTMEILDPTGRAARVDPSQITTIADHSLGLGQSSRIPEDSVKTIVRQMRATLRMEDDDIGEYKRLVSGLEKAVESDTIEEEHDLFDNADDRSLMLRTQSAPSAPVNATLSRFENNQTMSKYELKQLEVLANEAGVIPGVDRAAVAINLGNETEKNFLLKVATEVEGDLNKNDESLLLSKSPKYKLSTLTKFERDSLDRNIDRHKSRIENGTQQIAGGRLFKGDAFVSKPAELIFKDFEVGKKYRKVFLMTNVSYSFNSFKLLSIEDDYIDFFEVTFTKPGRMSAGVSCSIEILFNPQLNQDIFTNLEFLTETGPVHVPLRALIKRCAPRVTTPLIDFSNVVIGQKVVMPLKITNSQALPSKISIYPVQEEALKASEQIVGSVPEEPETTVDDIDIVTTEFALNEAELLARVRRIMTATERRKKRENPFPLSIIDNGKLSVDGYDSTSIDVVCAPLQVGAINQKFAVVFDGVDEEARSVDENGELITQEQIVTVETTGEEVPIYVLEETLDLKCTLYDRIYRMKVVVCNRKRSAYRVQINILPQYREYVEVNPAMCFVQPNSSQSINVRFTPKRNMMKCLRHFIVPYEDYEAAGLFCLPIEIQVANQELPAYFIVRSMICSSSLMLSTSTIEFNKIYVGQKSTKTIVLTNKSMLPQKIAFVKLRKEFHVEPNEGFAVLLPNESMEFEVSFCPVSAINYEVSLNIMTSFNDKYVVKVVAEGVEPPLLVSSAAIHLRTTGPGEKVIESTMITNNTPHSQSFEVMVPDKRFSWITVSPTAVNLLAGQSCRLEIEYHPPANLQELDPVEWHDGILTELKAAQSSEEVSVPVNSPFEEWIGNCGWMFGSGMFGSVQWPKLGAGKPELATAVHQGETEENLDKANSLNNSVKDELEEAKDAFPETEGNPRGLMEGILSADDGTTYEEVSNDEWGVIGKWNFPILVRPRRRNPSAAVTNNSVNKNISASISMSTSRPNLSPTKTTQDSSAPAPLILSLVTAVILPQIDADVKMLDFGQIAIGTRLLKTFKIVNKGYYPVILTADGFNALGPFNLIRPIKEIQSGESRNVIVECQPTQPGLLVEILRIRCKDERLGGHELRITAKVQGLKPVIELLDLSSPPAVWNPRSGILDFGTCLVNDVVKKKFSIKNKSSFAIDTQLLRVVSKGLPLSDQAAMIARTASGLPVIAICPERVIIQEGATQEIEVVFRPDRGRQLPFSEEIDVLVGSSDEVLRVGIFGRCATKQYFVQPADPRDEPFCKDYNSQLVNVEDLLAKHSSLAVRKASAEARTSLGLSLPEDPPIILEYPNPFAEGVDPQSYIEATDIAAPGKGKAAAVDVPPGSRKQIRKLILGATRVSDNRAGLAAATYEIVLNEEAKASGLWTLSADKGNLSMTDNTMIEITCTLKRPRSLGGLFVGSWQTYEANILIKGGWAPEGDSNEQNIKVVMKAYVSLS